MFLTQLFKGRHPFVRGAIHFVQKILANQKVSIFMHSNLLHTTPRIPEEAHYPISCILIGCRRFSIINGDYAKFNGYLTITNGDSP